MDSAGFSDPRVHVWLASWSWEREQWSASQSHVGIVGWGWPTECRQVNFEDFDNFWAQCGDLDYSLKLTWRKYMLILLGFRTPTSWVNSVIDMIFSSWFTGSRCFHIYRHPPIFDGRKHVKICKHHVKKEHTMSFPWLNPSASMVFQRRTFIEATLGVQEALLLRLHGLEQCGGALSNFSLDVYLLEVILLDVGSTWEALAAINYIISYFHLGMVFLHVFTNHVWWLWGWFRPEFIESIFDKFSPMGRGCCSPDEGQTPKRIEKLENHIRKHHQTVYCCFMAAKSLGLPHTFPSMANLGVVDKWIFNMMKRYSQIKSFFLRHTNHPNDYDQPNVCVCKHVTAKMSLNQQILG